MVNLGKEIWFLQMWRNNATKIIKKMCFHYCLNFKLYLMLENLNIQILYQRKMLKSSCFIDVTSSIFYFLFFILNANIVEFILKSLPSNVYLFNFYHEIFNRLFIFKRQFIILSHHKRYFYFQFIKQSLFLEINKQKEHHTHRKPVSQIILLFIINLYQKAGSSATYYNYTNFHNLYSVIDSKYISNKQFDIQYQKNMYSNFSYQTQSSSSYPNTQKKFNASIQQPLRSNLIEKQIQRSNQHVDNLITSIKKIIRPTQQRLNKEDLQKLEIKISIQKDHLKNSFYKISCYHQEQQNNQQYQQNKLLQTGDNTRITEYSVNNQPNQKSKQLERVQMKNFSGKQQIIQIKQWNEITPYRAKQSSKKMDQLSSYKDHQQKMRDSKVQRIQFMRSSPSKSQNMTKIQYSPGYYKLNYFSGIKNKQDLSKQPKVEREHEQPSNSNKLRQSKQEPPKIIVSRIVQQTQQDYSPQFAMTLSKNGDLRMRYSKTQKNNQYNQVHNLSPSRSHKDQQIKTSSNTPLKNLITIRTQTEKNYLPQALQASSNNISVTLHENKQIQIIKQTESGPKKTSPKTQHVFNTLYKYPTSSLNSQEQKRFQSSNKLNEKQFLESSTLSYNSYHDILNKNKSRLKERNCRLENKNEQNIFNSSQNDFKTMNKFQTPKKYEIHVDKLDQKRQLSKSRLYGNIDRNRSNSRVKQDINQISSIKQGYDYANRYEKGSISSHKRKKYEINHKNKNNKNYNQTSSNNISQNQRPSRSPSKSNISMSSSKPTSLHTTTLKTQYKPTYATKCKRCSTHSSLLKNSPGTLPQQLDKLQYQYHLVKKYLTPQGQKECYNFLRSQGIPQKDWGIFVTEYVYRQLSKAYKQEVKQSRLDRKECEATQIKKQQNKRKDKTQQQDIYEQRVSIQIKQAQYR